MFPKVLQLNSFGHPVDFIDYNDAVCAYAKGHVLWELGEDGEMFTVHGGTSRMTGQQSTVAVRPIIAIRNIAGSGGGSGKIGMTPRLTNKNLFARDQHTCGYCGNVYSDAHLSRDHIVPVAQRGEDKWMNVITACKPCNNIKADKTPEEAHMPLLFAPYVPSHAEQLILGNRKGILPSQLEFLRPMVNINSRVFAHV